MSGMACDELETCEFMMTALNETSTHHSNMPISLSGQSVGSPPLLDFGVSASVPLHQTLPHPKASDRESRIRAEKQRRSNYNLLIADLTSLLPAVARSQRKIDKTSVLRLAANELRNVHVFGNSFKCTHMEPWSKILSVLDLLGGFLITITCRGRICNVSPNVQEKLGHCHIDLEGQDIKDYVHPEDLETLRSHIYPPELQAGLDDNSLYNKKHDFVVRLMKAGARSDPPKYETCRIDGTLRKADRATSNAVQDEQIIRRQRVRHNRTFSSSGNDIVFVGMVRVDSGRRLPPRILPPTAYTEYWTRHLIDGRIVQVDQGISLVAGYMTEEVTGTSAFFYMHKEDVRWVVCVLRQMYDQSKEFGESYYRLMSRTGHFLYMRTRGFLEIDSKNKQVQSFVCINSVIGEDYGKQMMEEMKRKYSVLVNMKESADKAMVMGEAPVEHPKHLERILMHLVEPPSQLDCPEPIKIIPPSKDNIISAIKNSERVVSTTGIKFDSRKRKLNEALDETNGNVTKRHNCV